MRLIDADEIDVREVICGASDFAQDIREAVQRIIDRQPTIEAAPVVHARWELFGDHGMSVVYQCTHCGFRRVESLISAYCPNCGARMDGKGEHERERM